MAEISAAQVKQLREQTGAGPLECKKALADCGGDFEKAEKILKEKGLAAVETRSGRAANEGKIFARIKGAKVALVELSSETDFVARNPEFIELGNAIADRILEAGYTEPNEALHGMVAGLAAKIRENMALKRFRLITAEANEYLTKYIHGDGAIGVVVKLAADGDGAFQKEAVTSLAFNLALHIAAFNPRALERAGLDSAFIREQEEVFKKQLEGDEKLAGKPEKVIQGILKGKLQKYLADICLLEQGYVKDEKITVAQALADCGKQAGTVLRVIDYAYFKVGG